MKTTILAIVSIFCALTMNAQNITITKQVPLLKGVESSAYYPVLSADGQQLLYSLSSQYTGLKMYDFKSDVSVKISDANKAGLYPSFSNDGKVYFITQDVINNLNYRNVESYDIKSQKTSLLIAKQRNVMTPRALKNGVAVKTLDGLKKTTSDNSTYVYTEGSAIVIARNGVEKSYTPVESQAGYLWSSLSPDGKKVLFFAAGKGIFITDLNGKVISKLGNFECPVWYGDDYVVAQNATDDGHQYSSSQIVILKADGSFKKELTTPTSMAMNPTASAKANRIVYNTIDGRMYLMEINISQ